MKQDILSCEQACRHFLRIIKNSLYLCPENRDWQKRTVFLLSYQWRLCGETEKSGVVIR